MKTPFTVCKYALVPEIFQFENCVKYANEMADDVIYSTQFCIMSRENKGTEREAPGPALGICQLHLSYL